LSLLLPLGTPTLPECPWHKPAGQGTASCCAFCKNTITAERHPYDVTVSMVLSLCQRPMVPVPGQPQEECPLTSFLYKGHHGVSAIPCDSLRRPVRNFRLSDCDTFTMQRRPMPSL